MISFIRRKLNSALMLCYDLLNNNKKWPFVKNLVHADTNSRHFRDPEVFKIINTYIARNDSVPLTQICRYANSVKDLFVSSENRKNALLEIPDETFFYFIVGACHLCVTK